MDWFPSDGVPRSSRPFEDFRRRVRVLIAKTPVVGIILSAATLYGLWLVATTTTVPEFISAAAQLSDDGVYFANSPATPGTFIARVSLVDGNGKRHEAKLLRRESTAARTQVWARSDGRIETPKVTMEFAVGERSLLSYAVAVLFRRDR